MRGSGSFGIAILGGLGVLWTVGVALAAEPGQFVDVTEAAGVDFDHQTTQTVLSRSAIEAAPPDTMDEVEFLDSTTEIMSTWLTGGVTVGDYDGDGLPDIFAVGGDAGTAKLYRNLGDGTFEDKASAAGVAISGERQAGTMFVDFDGDFDLDLFVGGAVGLMPRLFRNDGQNGEGETTFTDVFAATFPDYDVDRVPNNWGGGFGDYDLDGDLDVFFAHSMTPFGPEIHELTDSTQHLFRNNLESASLGGGATFTDVSLTAGISPTFSVPKPGEVNRLDHTFSPAFADIDEDGWPDLLIVSDRGESLVYVNEQDGTFRDETDYSLFAGPMMTSVAGMGAAVGDFDNDGHLDWFISQIHSPLDGNRLYRGDGTGELIDVGNVGMAEGYWGWGACFADLDNDRHLDIVHVNGFYWDGNAFHPSGLFNDMPAVAFIADGDGTFTERGAEIGLADIGEGRGISCFDYDRDGDIDVAISNHRGPFKLYQNTLISPAAVQSGQEGEEAPAGFVTVRLRGRAPNTEGVGAWLILRPPAAVQGTPAELLRSLRLDSNFLSTDLAEAHFGVGDWLGPFDLEVTWPGDPLAQGQVTTLSGIEVNSFLEVEQLHLIPPVELTFEEDAPAILAAAATGPAGEDRSMGIEWAEGTPGHVVGGGATFDASGRSAGTYPFFLGVRDAGGALTTVPSFDLEVLPAAPPVRSNAGPFGELPAGQVSATLTLETYEAATCRFGTVPGTAYGEMPETFSTTGGTVHESLLEGLTEGDAHTFYVRCSDPFGHANEDDVEISFLVPLTLFFDDFETGDSSKWSSVSP